jgi:PAS domain S-box-containing protein
MPVPANILLVDDQPANLLALEAMLEGLGQNLVRASSGDEALRKLLEHEFAVILLDVQMPGIDGFETARLIRARERSRQIPIIFITALSRSESNVFQGYSIGAVDYLFKPIVPEVLRSKVSFFVELFSKNQEIREQAAEIARMSRQNELILRSAADGLLGVDLSGEVTFINPAARRMIGSRERLFGRPLHDLVHPELPDDPACERESCALYQTLHVEPAYDLREGQFWRADGSSLPVEYTITPMRTDDGKAVGAVLTFRDITERRAAAMAQENERLYREARAANEAKDEFLATLSHELRTPMTAILGWLDMLALDETPDPELLKEGLETIRRSARLQAQLIDDLLDVSRIITGKFLFEVRPTAIGPAIGEAIDTVRPTAKEKGISIRADISENAEALVPGDPTRLRQVFWNLLSNAVKFSDAGGEVDIAIERSEDDVTIIVRDHGQGIDIDVLPHIFDRLRQGRDARRFGGLGLGLAIARHIVETHGGAIAAESEGAGQGATFRVSLPVWRENSSADRRILDVGAARG